MAVNLLAKQPKASKKDVQRVLDPKFDFLGWLDLVRLIYSADLKVTDLITALTACITKETSNKSDEKILRDSICKLMLYHRGRSSNSDLIVKMRCRLQSLQSARISNNPDDSEVPNDASGSCSSSSSSSSSASATNPLSPTTAKNNDQSEDPFYFCHYVFSVDSLLCHTYRYLDLLSVVKCGRTCRNWLEKAYDPASFYYFNIADIMHVEKVETQNYPFNHTSFEPRLNFTNIERFQNARHVEVENWPTKYGACLKILSTKFKRVEHIVLRQSEMESSVGSDDRFDPNYTKCIECLLENNKDHIKSIKKVVYGPAGSIRNDRPTNELLKAPLEKLSNSIATSIYFPRLEKYSIEGNYDIFMVSSDNLKCLEWNRVVCTPDVSKKLVENRKNAFRSIERFVCTGSDSVKTKVSLCLILNAMVNLRHLRLGLMFTPQGVLWCVYNLALSPHCWKLESLHLDLNLPSGVADDEDEQSYESFDKFAASKNCEETPIKRYNFTNLTHLCITENAHKNPKAPVHAAAILSHLLACLKFENNTNISTSESEKKSLDELNDSNGSYRTSAGAAAAVAGSCGNLKDLCIESSANIGKISTLIAASGAISAAKLKRCRIETIRENDSDSDDDRGFNRGKYSFLTTVAIPTIAECIDAMDATNRYLVADAPNCQFEFINAFEMKDHLWREILNRDSQSGKSNAKALVQLLSEWSERGNIMCDIRFHRTSIQHEFMDYVMDKMAKSTGDAGAFPALRSKVNFDVSNRIVDIKVLKI